jgi:hypothetical protein
MGECPSPIGVSGKLVGEIRSRAARINQPGAIQLSKTVALEEFLFQTKHWLIWIDSRDAGMIS